MAENRKKKPFLNRLFANIGYKPPAQTYEQRIGGEYMQPAHKPGVAMAATPAEETAVEQQFEQNNVMAPMDLNQGPDIVKESVGEDTKYSIGNNSITVHGGDKVTPTGMSPLKMTTPQRTGGGRLKRGEVLMEPVTAKNVENRQNPLDGLITRDMAKEMGLGVNQWRELNKTLLENRGGLMRQEAANQGAGNVARVNTEGDLAKIREENQSQSEKLKQLLSMSQLQLNEDERKLLKKRIAEFDAPIVQQPAEVEDDEDILDLGITNVYDQMMRP